MDLHPCECGSADFDRQHRLEQHGDDLVTVYEGACQQCGRVRRFSFRLSEEIPPPPPAFGGPRPSQIVAPDEFLDVAYRVSESAGIQLLNSPEPEHYKLRDAVAYSVAAFEEILKFIPEGQDAVPESAFTTEPGRARYLRDPGKFARALLQRNVEDARAVLADIDEVTPRPDQP